MAPAAQGAGRSRACSSRSVVPVSIAVPGRARLRVDGLRGRPALKFHLEDRLAAHPAVWQAKANDLTGTLLVLFDVRTVTVRASWRRPRSTARACRKAYPPLGLA